MDRSYVLSHILWQRSLNKKEAVHVVHTTDDLVAEVTDVVAVLDLLHLVIIAMTEIKHLDASLNVDDILHRIQIVVINVHRLEIIVKKLHVLQVTNVSDLLRPMVKLIH